ncbi:MAG: hypothetical protein AAGF11_35840 [Myxococcota bacterium]
MTTTPTASSTIEALSAELSEVEWFGRSTLEQTPPRVAPLDLMLVMLGAMLGAALYLYGPL